MDESLCHMIGHKYNMQVGFGKLKRYWTCLNEKMILVTCEQVKSPHLNPHASTPSQMKSSFDERHLLSNVEQGMLHPR